MDRELSHKEALSLLINAVELGQKRGVWKLEEAATLARAVNVFTKPKQHIEQQSEMSSIQEEQN